MTFTNTAAELNWIGRRVALLSSQACSALMSGQKEKAQKISRESDALIARYTALGGSHYDLAGF